MAPKKTPAGPTPVDSFLHEDKRTNIPTADAQEFVTPEIEAVRKVRYARDESLDPQLVWKGKYPDIEHIAEADLDLVTDAPPIYIQEKIDPRVLVENLRRTAARAEDEPELTLFDTFDGLAELDVVDFYRHDANWSNRMILGDSLQVMASLAEREQLRGKVQMIYIDPPYGIKFGSNWQVRVDKRSIADGKLEDAAREAEQIKAFRDTWEFGIHSYLGYLRDRLFAARELLTETGSCFVQIGDENVHLVRSLMDEVFGGDNFINQITLKKAAGAGSPTGATASLPRIADYLVWYAVSKDNLKYRPAYSEKTLADESTARVYRRVLLPDGSDRPLIPAETTDPTLLPTGSRIYRWDTLTNASPGGRFEFKFQGSAYLPPRGYWLTTEAGMSRLALARRIYASGQGGLSYIRYLDDFGVSPINNVWTDVSQGGFTDDKIYVVQTATKIVQRCLLMTTDPGDLVLDPTCGSGTTAYTAEQWGRRWITIDTSRVALALARQRLMGAKYLWYLLADSAEGHAKEQSLTAKPISRHRFGDDIRQGFVHERVQHITLKSIANNPDIREGMSREQIDAAVKRHAEFEVLYDKPYEDKSKVRVTGPFTVESLSPHRSLSFSGDPARESLSETEAAKDADTPNFEQSILDNLTVAGIQNGRRNERIKFASFETYAGQYIQAVGESAGGDGGVSGDTGGAPARIGVAIGPQ